MLILPPNDKGSKFQCYKSCLSLVKSGEKLALNMSWKTCVIQIPKYLNFCPGDFPVCISLIALVSSSTEKGLSSSDAVLV